MPEEAVIKTIGSNSIVQKVKERMASRTRAEIGNQCNEGSKVIKANYR